MHRPYDIQVCDQLRVSHAGNGFPLARLTHFLPGWILRTVICTLSFFWPQLVSATVIVPLSESDLTQQATAVVVGTVDAIESYWDSQAEQIFTRVTISPHEVLKGSLAPGPLTLKQHGGTVGNRQAWLDGSPQFTRGERVLLFLDAHTDGSARTAQLYLGKFSLFTDRDSGQEFAYRDHQEVHFSSHTSSGHTAIAPDTMEVHDLRLLKDRISTTLQHAPQSAALPALSFSPVTLPSNTPVEQRESFVLVRSPAIRWFEPDTENLVALSINPDNAFAGGEERIATGFDVWNTVPDSVFRFSRNNNTNAKGFRADGISAISFSDPLNDLPNPVGCSGILAAVLHNGVSTDSRTLHGQLFFRITEADLVFANGWENCDIFNDEVKVDEITTHELGHVLGLGHSPSQDSIMFARARFDGRGASLAQEDEDGVAFLYPDVSFPVCTYTLSATKRTVSGTATTGKVSLSTNPRCGWSAFANVEWISIIEGASSSGDGTVEYAVSANSGRRSRKGRLIIAGREFTITQKGSSQPGRKRPPPFAPG